MGNTVDTMLSKLNSFIRKYYIFLLFLLFCFTGVFLFARHTYKHNIPDEVKDFYDGFLNAYCYESFYEVDPYIHYEVPEYWKLTEEDFSNITSYNIIGWERLNDCLWVVTLDATTAIEPDVSRWHHFIGYIDSNLYVMIGVYQVPSSLSKGNNLNRFIPKDALSADTVEIFDIFNK